MNTFEERSAFMIVVNSPFFLVTESSPTARRLVSLRLTWDAGPNEAGCSRVPVCKNNSQGLCPGKR